MNKAVRLDLEALVEAMEDLGKNLDTMTLKTKIDVAARLRAVVKACEAVDAAVKAEIKVQRNGEPGMVIGDLFKAVMSIVPTTRLNQKKLEIDFPKAYAKCLEKSDVTRITYEAR